MDNTPAIETTQSLPPTKQDKLREIWLKDRQKRKGQPKKVRLGLRRKLFMMILALIFGLLAVVYTMTLADEERVLRRELEIRGGTVARNLADTVYNIYTSKIASNPQEVNSPQPFAPPEFSDAMSKASEQQDFITAYALDPKNRALIHSSKFGYLFAQTTPQDVFDFKSIYPIKIYLEQYFEKQNIPVDQIISKGNAILKNLGRFEKELELSSVRLKEGTVYPRLQEKDGKIILYAKTIIKNKTYEKEISLNITKQDFLKIGQIALGLIKQDYGEVTLFLKNSISELRKIRHSANLLQDKQLIKKSFSQLLPLPDNGTIFRTQLARILKNNDKLIADLKDKTVKAEAKKINKGLKNYLKRFSPIVQIHTRRISEKIQEEILYITYPMCETENYFNTYRGEVHLLLSQQGIKYTIANAKEKLQFAALLAIVAGTIFTIIMAFFITNPIKKLMTAMRRVGAGDLDQTVIVRVSDEIGVLADNFNEMTEGLREKERIRSAMNKAVSKEVAEVMLSGELKLGGDNKNITVLFSDIRSFTTISEQLTPEEVVEMLNEYMTLMTNIVEKHRGIVDKFVGDEIMALWGAPKSYGNDAIAAVKAALEMMKTLNEFNARRQAEGLMAIDIGIGLNTGEVIAGNMGSENRMNYTVIGDNVNLGARLEGTNKMYGTHIIISEYTHKEIKEYIYARELDLIKVKGKNEPVSIYEVMGLTEEGEAIRTTKE